MKTEDYWAQRMEQLNEAQLAKGEAFIERTKTEYRKAMAKIEKDIDAWYQRLAKSNEISLAEAKKLLKANELAEFHWTVDEYIKMGRLNAIDQRFMRELENASSKYHISRLEALQLQMKNHIETLSAGRQKGMHELTGGIYKDSYYGTVYELQKGIGVGSNFSTLDQRQLDMILTKPWAPDGTNFSSRIWKDKEKLLAELNTTLVQGLIRGESSEKLTKIMAERLGVSERAAATLVLTEAAYFSGAARRAGFEQLDVEKFQNIATLDRRTSDICRTMDKTIFPLAEAKQGLNCAPFHVRCRTVDIPYFEDNLKKRAARNEDGDTYEVPGDMSYEEWEKEHLPKEPPPESNLEPIKAVEPQIVKPTQPNPEQSAPTTSGIPDPEELPKLTKDEEAAIIRYIGGESYSLNDKLRRHHPLSFDEMGWVKQLDKALSKLPVYKGDLSRSLHFASSEELSDFLADIRPGTVIQYPQYISMTAAAEVYNPDGQVHFFILGAVSGKDITVYNPGELEVLFGRNWPFEVMEIEQIDGMYYILLRELTE
ncbi:minor capsid protein [Paenibacillus ferrarius]|uniref:minor capsid protein n=1 Tax=Paenibacillus ferrarius TaxID=1469647 RepID=UPI003D29D24F